MKRVYCLYRVSTNQQLHGEDIPMQRQSCLEFANAQKWTVIEELYEKGVSGFKMPIQKRDILQKIREDAALCKFDVLLVFMFDRLGRRDSETPFFVEELAMSGIEIWSVKEGRQVFNDHTDKLVNYICYWQASGESIKIFERTKTRMEQLTREGIFCGGPCPYGYRFVKSEHKNRKGLETHDLEIDPEEAIVIQKIYDLRICYGYGARKIASELVRLKMFNRDGEKFHPNSISSILRREQLTGIMIRGDVKSELIPRLQIIIPEIFQKAKEITMMRKKGKIPQRTTGQALLSGNIFCGHCGGRMFASTARKNNHVTDKKSERIPIYKCYNRVQHCGRCTGQTTYRAEKIDAEVLKRLKEYVSTNSKLQLSFEAFEQLNTPNKKMILGQWIKQVEVVSYEQLQIQWID